MKLTESKLKQLILDEIKSNLSPKETKELRRAIKEVEMLGQQYLESEERLMDLEFAYDSAQSYEEAVEIDNMMDEVLKELIEVQAEMQKYARKYHIEFYDSPKELVKRMKNKFRRKSI